MASWLSAVQWPRLIIEISAVCGIVGGAAVWAGDERYTQKSELQASISQVTKAIQCDSVLSEIARLEQTILYLESQNQSTGLQRVELESAKRRLARLGGCVGV